MYKTHSKKAPKRRLMTMEEIELDQDPEEDDGYYENKFRIERGDWYTVTSVYSFMQPC